MILTELNDRIKIDRHHLQTMPEEELFELISKAQAHFITGLSASRAGEEEVARERYQGAFELLPTHIEALDNYAIGLVEELRFADAIPALEQSAVAEPGSPLAFLYLTKCYQSHLGQPNPDPVLIAPPYCEGQVWKFCEAPEFAASRVWIRLVDMEKGGPVVHISVPHLGPAGTEIFFSHFPFSPKGLSKSNLVLTDERQRWDLPNDHFGEGFGMWRNAFDANKAGVFTAPVSEVATGMLEQMKRN